MKDLFNKIIKAPGNPNDRIKEDPLRILRALRFSSKLGFEIEKETKDAILRLFFCISCAVIRVRCGQRPPIIINY